MNYWEKANHSWSLDSIRFINTPTLKIQNMLFHIQEIGHFKAVKPYFTERENLPSYLIKYTLSGQGSLRYNGQKTLIKPGDIFFIDCKNYQYYQTESNDPWEMDWVHLYGGTVPVFYQEFLRSGSNVFHTNGDPEENTLHFIFSKLLQLQKQQTAKTDYEVSVLLHELLNEIIMQKYQINFADEDIPEHISDMKNFLEKNLQHTVTLEMLEKKYHINKYQLIKEFHQYVGSSPIDYQINQKISFVKKLLRYTSFTLQEISVNIGIDNYAYFSRLFKKRTGLSPKKYRDLMG